MCGAGDHIHLSETPLSTGHRDGIRELLKRAVWTKAKLRDIAAIFLNLLGTAVAHPAYSPCTIRASRSQGDSLYQIQRMRISLSILYQSEARVGGFLNIACFDQPNVGGLQNDPDTSFLSAQISFSFSMGLSGTSPDLRKLTAVNPD